MPATLTTLGLALLAGLLALLWSRHRWRRRQKRLQQLLDLCDGLEQLLDRSQQRMRGLQAVVGRVPSDIAAVANAALGTELPIREAKRDVLQHRLWIQKHATEASNAELDTARTALMRAQERLAAQLQALESAGAELDLATAATEAAARREPPTLRRPPGADAP